MQQAVVRSPQPRAPLGLPFRLKSPSAGCTEAPKDIWTQIYGSSTGRGVPKQEHVCQLWVISMSIHGYFRGGGITKGRESCEAYCPGPALATGKQTSASGSRGHTRARGKAGRCCWRRGVNCHASEGLSYSPCTAPAAAGSGTSGTNTPVHHPWLM